MPITNYLRFRSYSSARTPEPEKSRNGQNSQRYLPDDTIWTCSLFPLCHVLFCES
uniref:Uncharacterized protein n=1 Tax=Anguilla anguilla TaxID=7936 RepID=A0A0E9WAY9_ANGAN